MSSFAKMSDVTKEYIAPPRMTQSSCNPTLNTDQNLKVNISIEDVTSKENTCKGFFCKRLQLRHSKIENQFHLSVGGGGKFL